MKRFRAVCMRGDADALTQRLMWLRCVEVSAGNADGSDGPPALLDCAEKIAAAEKRLGDYQAAHYFLSGYAVKIKKLLAPKTELDEDALSVDFDAADRLARTALELRDAIAANEAEAARLRDRAAALAPWRTLPLPLGGTSTASTVTVTGVFAPGSDVAAAAAELESGFDAFAEIITADGAGTYVAVTAHKDVAAEALRFLSHRSMTRTADDGDTRPPAVITAEIEKKLAALERDKAKLAAEAAGLSDTMPELERATDAAMTELARISAEAKLTASDDVAVLTGWAPARDIEKISAEMDKIGAAYEFEDPGEGDDVPVLLTNACPADAFEPVVGLYSLPAYGTFDPTAVMSVFYVAIFGLMFADVGYGFVLTALCVAALKLLCPTGSMKKFIRMFAICGVSCMVCGALFGGYFGDIPAAVATGMLGMETAPDPSLWFNPINDPMTFLVVSLAVGALHLLAGLGVKFYILCKAGKPLDAIFDVGSWYLVFAGIAFVFIVPIAGKIMLAAGVLMLVLTQGREEKNPVKKLFKGVMSLYNIVGFASDLLSYSRILSLGLASAVIASVINILGTMGGLTVGGIIVFVIAFVLGHTVNLAINVLGCFVHTSRLQYIEFFGKFYEDGGRPFAPLSPELKYGTLPDLN